MNEYNNFLGKKKCPECKKTELDVWQFETPSHDTKIHKECNCGYSNTYIQEENIYYSFTSEWDHETYNIIDFINHYNSLTEKEKEDLTIKVNGIKEY